MGERKREDCARPGKIFVDFARCLIEYTMRARHDHVLCPGAQADDLALQAAPVDPVEYIQAIVIGQREDRAQRRLNPLGQQAMHAARL